MKTKSIKAWAVIEKDTREIINAGAVFPSRDSARIFASEVDAMVVPAKITYQTTTKK